MRKGAKFTPSTKGNYLSTQSDIQDFTRRLNIIETFWQQENSDKSILKNKSKRQIYSNNQDLQSITSKIEQMQPYITKHNDNLTKSERQALNELKSNDKLIFKKADKGGSLVLMTKEFYRDRLVMEGHLTTSSYKKVNENCDKIVFSKIKDHIQNYKEILTKNEIDYITNFKWESSNFYVLPKVHKSDKIIEIVKKSNSDYIEFETPPDDFKGRPIVAGVNSPTQRLSALLEKLLTPIAQTAQTYIKDDWHFLKSLPKELNFDNITLYSVDIASLYTSISHELGIEAINYWITKKGNLIPDRFTKEFILESLKIVLENNNFIFNNQHYNQTEGTAMGTKCAPPYACLVISYLEECKLFTESLPLHFTDLECKWIITHYKRYMDDGFIPLLNSIDIKRFLDCLNSLHPGIKFTEEKGNFIETNGIKTQTLNFLDINVILTERNEIETDIYYKSTNSHDYLNYDSDHPEHTKENIPFNLAKRIICFVSNEDNMKKRLNELREFLKDNNYPNEVIEKGIFKAKLQGPAPKPLTTSTLPFVTTNFSNIKMDHIVSKANSLLKNTTNNTLREIFTNRQVILSQRQPKSLLKHLSTAIFKDAKLNDQEEQKPLISKCTDKRCKLCALYLQTDESFILANKKTWFVKRRMSCQSKNVIYYLTCNRCNGIETYIGKTNNLRFRTNQHISTCRTGNGSDKFDQHVNKCNESMDLVEPFFKLYLLLELKDEKNLLTYESHFHKLGFDTMN